jgi:hypothetical protein
MNFFFERMASASAATFLVLQLLPVAAKRNFEHYFAGVQTYSLPLKIVQRKRNKKYFS